MLPWSPLGGGWLTGKYRRDLRRPARPVWARTRTGAWRPMGGATPEERTWRVIEAVRSVARPEGLDGPGGAGLAGRSPGGDLGHPRGTDAGAVGRQPGRSWPAPVRRGDGPASTEASTPIVDDYPYGELGVSQRDRGLPAPWSSTPTPHSAHNRDLRVRPLGRLLIPPPVPPRCSRAGTSWDDTSTWRPALHRH